VLDPGVIPEIKGVTKWVEMALRTLINLLNPLRRFPANEYISGASKIPTIIYYDRAGNVKAVGAEAVKEGIYEIAEDEHWVKAVWYVLIFSSAVCFTTKPGSNSISDLGTVGGQDPSTTSQ
jgi:hypothetical protein